MINLKIVLLGIFLLAQGCGYQSVHKIERENFSIIKFEITGDQKISRYLENNFKKFEKNSDSKYIYELTINSEIVKKIQSKNSAGVTQNLTLDVIIKIKIKEDGKTLAEKTFQESVGYANLDNKFELSQYEKIIVKDQTNKIINKINFFIPTLK